MHRLFQTLSERWRGLVCGLAVVAAFQSPAAGQTLPIVKVGAAELLSPNDALAVFGSPVSPAPPSSRDPLVQEMARSLRYDIDVIFEHVRDHVELTPMYGLQKGARGVILDEHGTAFDQAQFLVEMLREADAVAGRGYNPSYVLGQISLTSAQFSAWFGVSDADAARHVLADGGIPATVTGSGTSFSVTMAHIWVRATVGGANYVFDPSYKPHSATAGIGLPAAMGYDGGQLLSSGVASATANNSVSIQGFSKSGFRAKLDQFRGNLEGYLANPGNGLVGAKIDSIVGHRSIVAHDPVQRRRSALPYAVGEDQAWAGAIPNAYRTSLSLSITGWSAPGVFYADEIYGKPLQFYFPSSTNPYATQAMTPVLSSASNIDCDFYDDGGSPSQTLVTIQVDHPYAAQGGHYMDRTISKQVSWRSCSGGHFILTNDWGEIGSKTVELMRRGTELYKYDGGPKGNLVTGPTLQSIAAQYSSYLDLTAKALGGVVQMHDLIGIQQIDHVDIEIRTTDNGNGGSKTYSPQQMLTIDFEAGVSANPTDGMDTGRRSGLISASVGGLSVVESAVTRQEADSPRDVTSLTFMTGQDELAWNPGSYPHYLATPANWSSVRGLLQNYPAPMLPLLDGYIGAGYSLFLPQQGTLRPQTFNVSAGVGSRWETLLDTMPTTSVGAQTFTRATVYAFNTAGDGAYLVYDPRHRRLTKGGINVSITDPSQNIVRQPDAPKASSKDVVLSDLKIDDRSGAATYAPGADLADGAGEFPRQLTLQRRYDASDGTDYGFGVGWKHNWQHAVTLSNDGMAALGRSGGFGAASALVAIQATADLAAGNVDPAHLLASANIQQWLVDQTTNNVAIVTAGLSGEESFFRRVDGSFMAAAPTGAQLVQSGVSSDSLINRRIYNGVSFVYRGKTGDTRNYEYLLNPQDPLSYSEPLYISKLTRKSFYMTSWAMPDGLVVTADYTIASSPYEVTSLKSVTNNLGASITRSAFLYGDTFGAGPCKANGEYNSNPTLGQVIYASSSGAEAFYVKTASAGNEPICGDGHSSNLVKHAYSTRLLSFKSLTGLQWSYDYAVFPSSYGAGSRLSAIYRPSAPAPATPALAMTIGLNGAVRMAATATGATYQYFSSPYRGEKLDALGASSVTYFDEYNRATKVVDPLGRVSLTSYDLRDRVVRTVKPEGDATDQAYDQRSNLIQQIDHAKLGSGLADLVSSATYGEAAGAVACSNLVTCNKPISVTDARGAVTNYAWDGATGNLTQMLKPADANGQRPQTDFGYASFGSGFSLLTAKTEKLTASQSTITTYGYNSGNKYVLASSTVDAGGLNLTTSYAFDAIGNLTAVDGPRTDVVDVTNYTWDADRRLTMSIDPAVNSVRRAMRYRYDADGLLAYVDQGLTTASDGSNFSVQATATTLYDAVGNKVRTTSPTGEVAEYAYDADDRLKCTAVRMGPSLGDACAVLNTAGGYDRITQTVYDAAGQTLQTLQGVGSPDVRTYATYTYSANGKQTSVQDANHNLTTLVYDGFDRLTKQVFPTKARDTGASNPADYEAYGYDANGNRTNLTKRDGKSFTYVYDALNRETAKISPDGPQANVYTGYDLAGRKLYALYASIGGSGIAYSYDNAGRLASETSYGQAMSFQYDQASNRSRVTWPDGFYAAYGYDAASRISTVKDSSGFTLVGYAYNDVARTRTVTRGNGVSATYAFDASDRLTSLSHDLAGTANDNTWLFAYNPVSQVLSRTTSNSLYVWTGHPSGTKNTTADGLNRDADLAAVQGGQCGVPGAGYDCNGNLTYDGTRTFTYDAENRLTKVAGIVNQADTDMAYDPLGRLTSSTAGGWIFLYDGDRLSAEYDASGTPTYRHIHGVGVDDPLVVYSGTGLATRQYYATDRQGSITSLSDDGGNVATNGLYTYGPYGETQAWTGSRFRYTGQAAIPQVGLYYYKARFYDPVMGRFLQTDPVGYKDDLDLYAYTGNDPLNNSDPTGKWLFPWEVPVSYEGGTTAQRNQLQVAYNHGANTPRGREIVADIYGRGLAHGHPIVIHVDQGSARAVLNGNDVYVNPDFHPLINTTSGIVQASTERVLWHEIPHAVEGAEDRGRGRMDNVRENENPIAQALGQPARTSYSAPAQQGGGQSGGASQQQKSETQVCTGSRVPQRGAC